MTQGLPSRLRDQLPLLARTARMIGPAATLRRLVEQLLRERPERDRSFDVRHGTDTSGSLQPADLGITDAVARTQAVLYLPSPARVTRYLLRSLPGPAEPWSFVDLGAGKGRVLLIAAELPFREVVGVEISPALHAAAEANLARYRRGPARIQRIRVELADARTVELPHGDTVFYLYHPFGAPILRAVLRRIERSLQERPRRVRIVYLGAFIEAMMVFAEFRFLTQTRFEKCLEPKYVWALFENTSGGVDRK